MTTLLLTINKKIKSVQKELEQYEAKGMEFEAHIAEEILDRLERMFEDNLDYATEQDAKELNINRAIHALEVSDGWGVDFDDYTLDELKGCLDYMNMTGGEDYWCEGIYDIKKVIKKKKKSGK